MMIIYPNCGHSEVWLLDDWVDSTLADEGVSLDGAGILCECRTCHIVFEIRATEFKVVVEER